MPFVLYTHDGWGRVPVGEFATLAEARNAFETLGNDPWYRANGGVRGLELVETGPADQARRIDWLALF